MKKKLTEEQEKADLMYRAQLDALVNGDASQRKRYGLEQIPIHKMVEQIQYMEKQLLPAVKKKSGEGSHDYIFFAEVVKSLTWAIMLSDRFDMLDRRVGHLSLDNTLLREHVALMERELTKFHAMEDIYLTDAFDIYKRGVAQRIKDLLNEKEQLKQK